MSKVAVGAIVERFDWGSSDFGTLRAGPDDRRTLATRLKASLTAMLSASTDADAEAAYFAGVENVAFVSGMVFGVSASVTDCVLEAWVLASPPGRRWGLVALQQIACGADAGSLSSDPDLRTVEYCRSRLRDHLEMLYAALGQEGPRWSAAKILTAIELDGTRLRTRFAAALASEPDPLVRQVLEDGLRGE